MTARKSTRGCCDRCGWEVAHAALKPEYQAGKRTGFLVCGKCFDPDHPQLRPFRGPLDDGRQVKNPRPDPSRPQAIALFGWNPIGHPSTQMLASAGRLRVATS